MSKKHIHPNTVGKGFDRITAVYDVLTRFASFNQINKSQLAFLSQLSTQSSCLILGGGTGYFLQELLETNATIHITYVDASEKMIAYSKKRIAKVLPNALHRVDFVCTRVEDISFETYDCIVCNYFLDLFEDAEVDALIQTFKIHMNKNALLYVTDFSIPETKLLAWTTKIGLKILYAFFKWTTYLPTKQLPSIQKIINQNGFDCVNSKLFLKGILYCAVYKVYKVI